jgi:thiol-disulfide isomerase/thioredoxin
VDVTQVHAPWCATCEKVGRVFEKLAKHVQDVPSLVMAKYDAQENEHPLLLVKNMIPLFFLLFWGMEAKFLA